MPLSSGTRLGPYEILAPLGAGGMGEVYRAPDTKLDREVAIKVLPDAVAADPERLARFEREAKVLAQLNHPGIASIYGVEGRALVMELVAGPTLDIRIAQGPIPPAEAEEILLQIAGALEYAHERGIVHRDLKPANIKIDPEDNVKILDFGLAKALSDPTASASGDPTNSPTMTTGATIAGAILGTAAYMAPEQARGKKVDKRADIWAFGVVAYEMLTGERLFQGDDVVQVLGRVLEYKPPLDRVPAKFRPLLARCLDRNPKDRLRDIGETRFLLAAAVPPEGLEVSAAASEQARSSRGFAPWAAAAVCLLALAGLAFVHFREQPEQRQVLQYTVPAPEKANRVSFLTVSPDGRYLAMIASGEGPQQIWVHSLDSLQTQALAGTEEALYPFWSPDSRHIAFFAQNKLKRILVNGGPAQTLCDAPTPRGGTWSEGVILFAPNNGNKGLSRVPDAGGVPVNITHVETGTHRWPAFLPDGKRFLYLATGGRANGIFLSSLDNPKGARRLAMDEANPQYLAPAPGSAVGHLLFVREGTLMAQPVDPKTMDNKGELFPLAQQISSGSSIGMNLYSISATGMLVYSNGGGSGAARQLIWLDRTGKELELAGGPVPIRYNFALSPEGKRIVMERVAEGPGNSDLWITDMGHGGRETRITFDASRNSFPVWSPDGNRVAFGSSRRDIMSLYWRAANGTGQDELLFESKDANKLPWDWSHDGRFILFLVTDPKTGDDMWALPVTGQGEKKPLVVLNSPFRESQGQFSPDGRWLAYTSNESGNEQVYVTPFAPGFDRPIAGKWQISLAGGTQPRWRGDGKELYYVAPDRKLMAVEAKGTAQTFERGTPQPLFELRSAVSQTNSFLWGYVPSADGKRFLVSEIPGVNRNAPPPAMIVVVNWLGSVKK